MGRYLLSKISVWLDSMNERAWQAPRDGYNPPPTGPPPKAPPPPPPPRPQVIEVRHRCEECPYRQAYQSLPKGTKREPPPRDWRNPYQGNPDPSKPQS